MHQTPRPEPAVQPVTVLRDNLWPGVVSSWAEFRAKMTDGQRDWIVTDIMIIPELFRYLQCPYFWRNVRILLLLSRDDEVQISTASVRQFYVDFMQDNIRYFPEDVVSYVHSMFRDCQNLPVPQRNQLLAVHTQRERERES